jgi:N-carbamoylputrescine amidase
MALMGAEILFYPTAIGSEPPDPSNDSKDHWQTCMQGHSAANLMPVAASNRIGTETFERSEITFYGSSFITDNKGRILDQADRSTQGVILTEVDLEVYEIERDAWGVFRDRRPEAYTPLMTLDGETQL